MLISATDEQVTLTLPLLEMNNPQAAVKAPAMEKARVKPAPMREETVPEEEGEEPPAAVFTLHSPEEMEETERDKTCVHGVLCVPSTPEVKDAVVCLLCQEADDDSIALASGNPSKLNRKLKRISNVSSVDLGPDEEGNTDRECDDTGVLSEECQSRGSTGNLSMHKSYSCQETSAYALTYNRDSQDLRRTQSLKSLFCLPEDELPKHDRRLRQAHQCPRVSSRRNALNDPFKMPMPQETRERIQRETLERKTSVKKRVSTYFKSLVEAEPEVDLI